MNEGVVIEPDRVGFLLSLSKIFALVIFTVGTVIFIYTVRDSMKANMDANNANQAKQMAALNQLACQNRWQLYNLRNTLAHYAGECERNAVD